MRKEFNEYVVWLVKELESTVFTELQKWQYRHYVKFVTQLDELLDGRKSSDAYNAWLTSWLFSVSASYGPFLQDCLCFLGAETSSSRIFDETTLPELFDTFARTACFLEQDLSKYNHFYEIAMKQYLVVKDYVDSASAVDSIG